MVALRAKPLTSPFPPFLPLYLFLLFSLLLYLSLHLPEPERVEIGERVVRDRRKSQQHLSELTLEDKVCFLAELINDISQTSLSLPLFYSQLALSILRSYITNLYMLLINLAIASVLYVWQYYILFSPKNKFWLKNWYTIPSYQIILYVVVHARLFNH